MRIQDAQHADAGAIAAIYNTAVVGTTAVWNETTVDAADRIDWMDARRATGFPVLVAIDDASGDVVGYASYGAWRAFDGYRRTVEHSVYVREDQRGRGLGRALLTALIARAREAGLHAMVAGVESGNVGSIRLHESLGFEHGGVLREVGAKFGRWLDLTFLLLVLDDRATPSEQPLSTPAPRIR